MNWQGLGNHPYMDPPLHKRISDYIFGFGDYLGKGSFSTVYRGRNLKTGQMVAIKVIELASLKSKTLQKLLYSEIEVLKSLNHPNILKCYEILVSDHNCYIMAELCNEGSLDNKLKKEGPMTQKKALPIIKDVLSGLCYLAQKKIVHRDIKAANIFISDDGRAKIADFGFAKCYDGNFIDISIGSPLYMAPQGFLSYIYGCKTDVWAFGIFIYELLHGRPRFTQCRSDKQLYQMMIKPIQKQDLRDGISNELKDVIISCLDIQEMKRPTIEEIAKMTFFKEVQRRSRSNNIYEVREVRDFRPESLKRRQVEGYSRPFIRDPLDSSSTKITEEPINKHIEKKYQLYQKFNTRTFPDRFKTVPSLYSIKMQDKSIQSPNIKDLVILQGNVSFEVCVNTMHYSRLINKFITIYKFNCPNPDNNALTTLTKWLFQVLEQLSTKIRRKEVNYSISNQMKEIKLRQVCQQYQKRYRFQLGYPFKENNSKGQQKYSLQFIKYYTYSLFKKIDPTVTQYLGSTCHQALLMAHCLILICQASKILYNCFLTNNYQQFSFFTDAQLLLKEQKINITWQSYEILRSRLNNF